MTFRRPFKLGELLGAIGVLALSLAISRQVAQIVFDQNRNTPELRAWAALFTVYCVGSGLAVYFALLHHRRRGQRPSLANLPERIWVLVETETGLIPMADTGIHALVFQREDQTAPWLARYPTTIMPECADRDHTLSAFRTCGVKWVVFYYGEHRTTWIMLRLTEAG